MINQVALLNEQKEKLTAEELTVKIGLKGVAVTGFFEHTKASERYVVLSVVDGGVAKENGICLIIIGARTFELTRSLNLLITFASVLSC